MSFPVGLASAWELNGSPNDSVGSAHLTLFNSPVYTTGKRGQGLDLESGASQYASAGAYPLLRNKSKFSLEVWFKPEALTDFQPLVVVMTGADSANRLGIFLGGAGLGGSNDLLLDVANGGLNTNATSNVDLLTAGAWAQSIMAFDGTQATNATRLVLYINGTARTLTFQGSVPTTTSNSADHPLQIGRAGTGTTYADGVIDMVRVWPDVALTAGDATYLWNAGAGRVLPGGLRSKLKKMGFSQSGR